MNTLFKYTFAITLSVLGFSEMTAQWGNKRVQGNGNVVTKTVNTQDYDAVKVVGSMDVHLEKGTEGTITVKTDENLHEYLVIEVKENNALVIRTKKHTNLRTKKGIHITVPFRDISKLSLVGSGDIDSKDTIDGDELEVSVTGSGDIVLDVEANLIDAKITGSGDMELTGSTKDVEVKVSGSGDFKGSSLTSQNAQAYVSGSGDIRIAVKNSIKGRVNGSGDIRYSGNPERSDTKVSGSGTIKSM